MAVIVMVEDPRHHAGKPVFFGAEVPLHTRKALLCFALFWCVALIAASCSDQEVLSPLTEPTGGGAVAFGLGEALVSAPPRASPGATIPVTVTAQNKSDGAIKPGDITLVYGGDPAWKSASLELAAPAGKGAVATFTGDLVAPDPGTYTLTWQPQHAGKSFGPSISATVLVTCSDGVFCNGVERFAGGKCLPGPLPCDDGQACTTDRCDEAAGRCAHDLGAGCDACFSSCAPDCAGKQCGPDGCGGSCGACPASQGCASVTGACKPANQPGTCESPIPLLMPGEPLIGQHTIMGDSTSALHEVTPTCNTTSTAVEVVYTFTTVDKVGIDARSSGYDTVLSIRKEDPNTPGSDCFDDKPVATVKCSDDAAPPGDYGSRVATALDPGTYYLIVDGFDASQFGPFTLSARFVQSGCVPQCDGRYCGGDDGCGGNCGDCGAGFSCVKGHCRPEPCVPDCTGKACGDDGCDGACGVCKTGELCVPASFTCKPFAICDHDHPVCSPACAADAFCGSDCVCHKVADPLPDLVIDKDRLKSEILFDSIDISPDSCAIVEQCVGGSGPRKLLRFSVEAVNQGQATLTVPPPAQRPDLFQFSPCHGHYHFNGFANYALLDEQGKVVLTGHKQAYCMEDTEQVEEGPQVACAKNFDCSNQGIQAGWSDLYGNALDCQWLDITGVPPGKYQIQVSLNPSHVFEEVSFDNNVATVPVTIP